MSRSMASGSGDGDGGGDLNRGASMSVAAARSIAAASASAAKSSASCRAAASASSAITRASKVSSASAAAGDCGGGAAGGETGCVPPSEEVRRGRASRTPSTSSDARGERAANGDAGAGAAAAACCATGLRGGDAAATCSEGGSVTAADRSAVKAPDGSYDSRSSAAASAKASASSAGANRDGEGGCAIAARGACPLRAGERARAQCAAAVHPTRRCPARSERRRVASPREAAGGLCAWALPAWRHRRASQCRNTSARTRCGADAGRSTPRAAQAPRSTRLGRERGAGVTRRAQHASLPSSLVVRHRACRLFALGAARPKRDCAVPQRRHHAAVGRRAALA